MKLLVLFSLLAAVTVGCGSTAQEDRFRLSQTHREQTIEVITVNSNNKKCDVVIVTSYFNSAGLAVANLGCY